MIVGMDIDDTISRHPQFFALMSNALRESGHTVVIVTVRQDRSDAERQLDAWKVQFDRLITFPEGQPPLELDVWKARMCAEASIEILFEDSVDVVRRVDHQRTLCLIPADPEFHEWI